MGFQNFVVSNKGAVESAETAACTQFLFAETAAYLHGLAYSSFFLSPPLKPRCQGRVVGFVGGGGYIAIATALPPSFVCIVL